MLINTTEQAHAKVERIFRVILPESGLTVRKEQILLCHDMLDGLLHNTISLCDAGVGIGKTYAYLVACILAQKYSLHLNRPIVISTSSVALQDAIIGEYLPFLSNVLLSGGIIDEPLTAHLRKGSLCRSSHRPCCSSTAYCLAANHRHRTRTDAIPRKPC